jgi:hypothetical protein
MIQQYHDVFQGNSVENMQAVLLPATGRACIGPGVQPGGRGNVAARSELCGEE